jgi:hypothetical protein
LPREVAGRRQACSGAQLPLLDGPAQLSFDLLSERSRLAAVDGEQHLVRTAWLGASANWSHRPGHSWIFSWRQSPGKITTMSTMRATTSPVRAEGHGGRASGASTATRQPINQRRGSPS